MQNRRKFLAASAMAAITAGSLPASLLAKKNKTEMPADDKGLIFLFQGDSITDGNRGRNADPNHIMGHGYAFAVASRVGADFPASGFIFYNRGVSGNKITDIQNRWQADTLDIKPEVLSILIGINDTAVAVEKKPDVQTVDDFETAYRKLLRGSRGK